MSRKPLCFLIFLLLISILPLSAQEAQYDYAREKQDEKQTVQEVQMQADKLQRQAFEMVDSLSAKSTALLNNSTDSLNSLYSQLENKIRSSIDSLQGKLSKLQNKGTGQISGANEQAAQLTKRIDSLQSLLSNKLQLNRLQQYASKIPGRYIAGNLNTNEVPALPKRSIPETSGLSSNKLNLDGLSGPGGELSSLASLNKLTSQVDQQLGKSKALKSKDWIKTDMPDHSQFTKEAQQYKEMVKDPSKIDKGADAQALQLSEFQELNKETLELKSMKELPESMLADLKRYQDEQALKAEAQEVVVKQATDYFADHQDKLSEAQSLMTQLKKKYSYVPDSRDLSTAVKATSLKNEPLGRRIRFGLGFQLHQTNPISIDLAPNLVYRMNTMFSLGISGTYRASLGIENNSSIAANTSTDVFGLSVLGQHMVWKGFFGHIELQYLNSPVKDPNTNVDTQSRTWTEGALLGIGKQMALTKGINGQIIFTYDFLHNDNSPNPRAWNIKFGFQLGKLNLKGIKF